MSYFNKLSHLLFFLIFTNFCFSQKVFIIDADNGNKIVNATVFSKQNLKSVISNINGEVDLSSFSSNDSLVFGHISYKNLITQKKSKNQKSRIRKFRIILRQKINLQRQKIKIPEK